MKKLIILSILTALFLSSPLRQCNAQGPLMKDSNINPVQYPAWDGSKTAALTVYSTTVDHSTDMYVGIYPTVTTCIYRLMPLSTSTKASYATSPLPQNTWTISAVNSNTPFGNYSGCTGYIKRH